MVPWDSYSLSNFPLISHKSIWICQNAQIRQNFNQWKHLTLCVIYVHMQKGIRWVKNFIFGMFQFLLFGSIRNNILSTMYVKDMLQYISSKKAFFYEHTFCVVCVNSHAKHEIRKPNCWMVYFLLQNLPNFLIAKLYRTQTRSQMHI